MGTTYTRKKNLLDVLRWLRSNGQRGVDWDFSGGRTMSITFKNSQLELAYIMEWCWYAPDSDTN